MAYNALNNLIDAYIYANGVQAITGQILNGVLKQMVSQLGSGYHLMGVATPQAVPATDDYAMAYFAATAGEYTDFGGITLAAGEVAVLLTSGNGSWSKQTIYNIPTGTADLENTAEFITNAVTDLVNYYTKTEVDDTLANYPTLEALATALADYYTKTEIDTQKAETDAALADRYTKSETDTALADYYKKTETYDKDEVDSIVAALSRQEYIVAWDGLAAPDVSAIPAGVTVTYSGTTYTGILDASASTVNKIYMVWNGTAYDMYGTSQDGGYSWVPMGTTTVDLSQYATKAEVSQLRQKVDENAAYSIETEEIDIATSATAGKYIKTNLAAGETVDLTPMDNAAFQYLTKDVVSGEVIKIKGCGGDGPRLWAFLDNDDKLLSKANSGDVATDYLTLIAPANGLLVINSVISTSYPFSVIVNEETIVSVKDAIAELYDKTEGIENTTAKVEELETIKDEVTEGTNQINLYDLTRDVPGNLTNSGTIDTSNHDFKTSDFISLRAGVPYTMSVYSNYYAYAGVYGYGIYGTDKTTWLGRQDVTESEVTAGYKTYIPSQDCYVRLRIGVNSNESTHIMFNEGSTLLPYTPYVEPTAIDKIARKKLGKDIKVTKVSNELILVSQRQEDGSYIDWQWVKRHYERDGIVCNEHWTTNNLLHNGNIIGQGNVNFVVRVSSHSYPNEETYSGNGHGCCVMDFCKFFADGKEVDVLSLTEPLYCKELRIMERSQVYAIDASASQSSDLGFPKLDGGVPVVAFIHYYNVIYTQSKCEYENYLTSKRDNTFFKRCYAAMLSAHIPYFTKVVIGDGNTYQYNITTDEKTPLYNSPALVSLMKLGTAYIYNTCSVLQYGDNYVFSTELYHTDDTPYSHTNIEPIFGKDALVSGDKKEQKMYYQPIKTYVAGYPNDHDILNNGDTIRVKVIKRISYKA